MKNLAEIMANEESLEKAAQEFADFHMAQQAYSADTLFTASQSACDDAKEIIAMLDRVGKQDINYTDFCRDSWHTVD